MIDLICPSRMRPERARLMAQSALDTAESRITVTIAVDCDEPMKDKYADIQNDRITVIECSTRGTISASNILYDITKQHYIISAADDVMFRTAGWDRKMISKMPMDDIGIVGCLNIENGRENYEHYLSSRKFYKLIGFYAYPKMYHYFVDSVIVYIARELDRRFCCTDVLIEHLRYDRPKGIKEDPVYKKNMAKYGQDKRIYEQDKPIFREIVKRLKGLTDD